MDPATTETPAAPETAFAAAGEAKPAATDDTPPAPPANPGEETPAAPETAFAAAGETKPAATTDGTPPAPSAKPGEETPAAEEKPVDLAKMSDDDYAKAAVPDVDGQDAPPDRSLITPMAKDLRELGVQPSLARKIIASYNRAVDAAIAKDAAERKARMDAARAETLKSLDESTIADIAACRARIAKDPDLMRVLSHTELGSNKTLLSLIALAGQALRAETSQPAAAAAGSGTTNLERAVFERTVPKDLR